MAAGLVAGGVGYVSGGLSEGAGGGTLTLPTDPETMSSGASTSPSTWRSAWTAIRARLLAFCRPDQAGLLGPGRRALRPPDRRRTRRRLRAQRDAGRDRLWSDGELFHAVTTGVSRDGRAMFPLMPYRTYGRVAEEDVRAILAYLRTLAPIANPVPTRTLDVPMNLIVQDDPAGRGLHREAVAPGSH